MTAVYARAMYTFNHKPALLGAATAGDLVRSTEGSIVDNAKAQGVMMDPSTGRVTIAPIPTVTPVVVLPTTGGGGMMGLPGWAVPVSIGAVVLGVVYFLFVRKPSPTSAT